MQPIWKKDVGFPFTLLYLFLHLEAKIRDVSGTCCYHGLGRKEGRKEKKFKRFSSKVDQKGWQ